MATKSLDFTASYNHGVGDPEREKLRRLRKESDSITNHPSEKILERLSASEFAIIRLGVAAHHNTSAETLRNLAENDEDKLVRQAAKNSLVLRSLRRF